MPRSLLTTQDEYEEYEFEAQVDEPAQVSLNENLQNMLNQNISTQEDATRPKLRTHQKLPVVHKVKPAGGKKTYEKAIKRVHVAGYQTV